VGVRCKCPDDGNLDRNCRYLPDCANGGYRSFSINLRCVCPPQWFGDLCEKFCLNGALYKDFASGGPDDGLGVDRCKCMKNFYGEACDEVQCFNGGTPVKGRGCLCQQPYVGPHCEEMSGVGQFDTPTSSSFHRDLSSTVVSLFLAVALALGVYLYDVSGLPPPPAYHDVVKIPPAYVDTRSQQTANLQPAPAPLVESTPAIPVNDSAPSETANSAEGETPSSSTASDTVQPEAQIRAASPREAAQSPPESNSVSQSEHQGNSGSQRPSENVHVV